MKNNRFIYLFIALFAFGFYSCNNEDSSIEDSKQDENVKYITPAARAVLLAGMNDSTTVFLETEEDFFNHRVAMSESREQELLSMGYTKIEENANLLRTKASVATYTIKSEPSGGAQISDIFSAQFSQKFCDQLNLGTQNKIYPNKKYLCVWRDVGTYFNLATNQSGGVLPSPKAGLRPSTKGSYYSGNAERGYDAYKNSHNQYILESHMLKVICEDVKHITVAIDGYYPVWNSVTGVYEINYAILTR